MDKDAGLFCKFLFVITIVRNFLGLTIMWFDISQSIVVLDYLLKSPISDATSVEDADDVLSSA